MHTTQIYTVEKRSILSIRIRDLGFWRMLQAVIGISFRLILLLAVIVTVLTLITSNTDLLFGIRSYTVLSGSMEPAVPTGSIIYSLKNLGYNVGDVVTYKLSTDQFVTHRIIEVQNNGEVLYLTKGDANAVPDSSYITADKIMGKTYVAIPFIGRISGMLKTPAGIFSAVILPALVVILFELWSIKKEIERSVEQRVLNKLKEQGGAHTHSQLWPESIS